MPEFSGIKIAAALRRQLGWTHFKAIILMTDPLKRGFYAEMCGIEQWSTRTMRNYQTLQSNKLHAIQHCPRTHQLHRRKASLTPCTQ